MVGNNSTCFATSAVSLSASAGFGAPTTAGTFSFDASFAFTERAKSYILCSCQCIPPGTDLL